MDYAKIMKKLCEYGEADRTFDNRIYYFCQNYIRTKRFGLPTLGIHFTDAALYNLDESIGYIDESGIHMELDNPEANMQYTAYIERQLSNI